MSVPNYKDTLNLPRTDFPMKAGLVQREPEFLERWEKEGLYQKIQSARREKTKFVLHDGPPFANGDVHMGTALNKILKDIIVKYKSMTGHHAPYVPGWDCHGLPIEYKVVKNDKNLTPLQARRKCEEFARKYVDIQRGQFKRLGVLGDWERPYLTLDKAYEAEVLRVFADLAGQEGLVYRGKKPVYWSTGAQTALAEAEVEYLEKDSPAVYVKFEALGEMPKTSVVIWTTTPWTLPANLAVAIHSRLKYARFQCGDEHVILCAELPKDAYEKMGVRMDSGSAVEVAHLLKLKLRHPFLDREVPVLHGDFVAADTGTGCVHIAPGHGQDDYNLAKHLGLLSPVDDEGKFTLECGAPELVGKYVFDANKDVVALLRAKGRLVADESIRHTYPHCWRSKTPIIFRSVEQWFIRVDQLRPAALKAIQSVKWIPGWGENRIRGTVETRSDWCISRQRSWGVPLPIFYRANGEPLLSREIALQVADLVERHGSHVWFEWSAAEWARELKLPEGVAKRGDTLDVWIDSGSSHRAVLLKKDRFGLEFPADLYLEGSDQHRGWFQSSLMTSVGVNDGKAPYKAVITNGFLVDLDGKKISKSGTYEKPKDAGSFISRYGADIVRLWVASENYQNDVPLSEEIFTRIGDTYRSIRNTLRILLGNLYDFNPDRDRVDFLSPSAREDRWAAVDLWMLSRLRKLIREVRSAYDAYEFHKVYHAVNSFCAVEVSALYVDITKDRMYCDPPDSRRRRATQTVMHETISSLARLLAPILSFTTEEAWMFLAKDGSSVHLQEMPDFPCWPYDAVVDGNSERVENVEFFLSHRMNVSEELEKHRQAKRIGKSIDARVILRLDRPEEVERMRPYLEQLAELFIVSQVDVEQGPGGVEIAAPRGKKCARSWRWDETVGRDPESPDLTARDAAAVRAVREALQKGANP